MKQNHELEKWLGRLALLSFGLLTILLVVASRKPNCIDSNVVGKIHIGDSSYIYKCANFRSAPLHGYLNSKLPFIDAFLKTERFLDSISPFSSKIDIEILSGDAFAYNLKPGLLSLSKELFETPGVVERSLIKLWLRDINSDYFSADLLSEEVYSDLLTFLSRGQWPGSFLRSESPERENLWSKELKTLDSYCRSEDVIVELLATCQHLNRFEIDPQLSGSMEFVEFSLKSMISSSWINAYNSLSLQAQVEFTRALPSLIRTLKLGPDLYLAALQSTRQNPWAGPYALAQRLNKIWSRSGVFLSVETQRQIQSRLAYELDIRGFSRMMDFQEFDLIYQSDEEISSRSPRFKSLVELSKKNPSLRILLKDPRRVWIVPNPTAFSPEVIRVAKAHKMVLETCGSVDFVRIFSFADVASRLLVVKNCDLKKPTSYSSFMTQGGEGFAIQNQTSLFVQFHLPSLLLRKKELLGAGDVFQFVGQRQIDSPSFQSLGWREINWNEQTKSYRPRGYIDAIEMFRVTPLPSTGPKSL